MPYITKIKQVRKRGIIIFIHLILGHNSHYKNFKEAITKILLPTNVSLLVSTIYHSQR